LYGKFPELGDFVNRRLPRSFLDPWDEWLQNAIATSKQQLGEDWLDLYLNGPIWRFVLSGGLCGEMPWTGLLMPSVDRVGRYFPLIIASRLPLDANLFQVAIEGNGWFEQAEDVILTALDEGGFDLDEFDRRVESLGDIEHLAELGAGSTQAGYGSAWRIPLDEEARLSTAMPGLLHQLVLQRIGPYSLWWGGGSQSVQPSLLVAAGMPPPPDFCAMLAGNWQHTGWEEWTMPIPAAVTAGDNYQNEEFDS
jgi:type VI secretion system protein ImpM